MKEAFKPKTEAKFNAGLAKLERIHKLRLKLHWAKEERALAICITCLESWRSEIGYKFNKTENDQCDKYESKITSALTDKQNAFNTSQLQNIAYRGIIAYERELNYLGYRYGFEMPDKGDARFALADD